MAKPIMWTLCSIRLPALLTLLAGAACLTQAQPFAPGTRVASLPDHLDEISGMAASRAYPGVLWVHNDSGAGPVVHAVRRNGKLLGSYSLQGAQAVDWEDMAIGPAPGGGSYLYLADIGDNAAQRESVQVYRVAEPAVDLNQAAVTTTLTGVDRFDLSYPGGARDAEGFMVDPITGDFYIVTKREWQNLVFRAPAPRPGAPITLTQAGTLPFTGATGADISADGMQVLIRRYSSAANPFTPMRTAASYWRRTDASISLLQLLGQNPTGELVPLVDEAQGEAIAFAPDGSGFYTTSEHATGSQRMSPSPVFFYPAMSR